MSKLVRAQTKNQRGWIPAALIAVGLLTSTLLMWQASNAAFNATTQNGSNTFNTGTVIISSSPGSAIFTVTGLKPGMTGSACITVTYTGSLAASVKMYASAVSTTNLLSSYIDLQIDQTTGSSTITAPSCASLGATTQLFNSTMASFGSSYTSFAAGLAAFSPPGGTITRDYKFTYTMSGSAPNNTQNSSAAITFNWEAQNT